jgi:hypothetical protein
MRNRLKVMMTRTLAGVVTLCAVAAVAMAADDAKKKIDAGGLTFEVPAAWKTTPTSSSMRRAQLKVEPLAGDDYPAELVVFAFPGGAGGVEANVKRWQNQFKDKDGNPPTIESTKVKGKNVDVIRVETAGHYVPANFGRPEPERDDAKLLGAIVITDQVGYFIKMVGPNKTMTKLKPVLDEMLASMTVEAN